MNQFIDKIIENLKFDKTIENLKREPIVKYNKNDKTISVKYTFDFGNIPIKLKKDRESWLKHDPDTTSPNQITFEMIRPFLSLRTSKKAKKDLEKYFHEAPDCFIDDVSTCILHANKNNPLSQTSIQPRGKTYDITLREMRKRRTTAKHLYLYLQKWLTKDEEKHPPELRKCLKRYNISRAEAKPKLATMKIITKYFDFIFRDSETFYQKYIVPPNGSLTRLKNSPYLVYIQEGRSPFLIPILKPTS